MTSVDVQKSEMLYKSPNSNDVKKIILDNQASMSFFFSLIYLIIAKLYHIDI